MHFQIFNLGFVTIQTSQVLKTCEVYRANQNSVPQRKVIDYLFASSNNS